MIRDGDLYLFSFGDRDYWYAYANDGVIIVRATDNRWVHIGIFRIKKPRK